MTNAEFDQLLIEISAFFPQTFNWLNGQGDMVMDRWAQTLAPVPYAAALGVLTDWANGNWPGDLQWQHFPGRLRQEATNRVREFVRQPPEAPRVPFAQTVQGLDGAPWLKRMMETENLEERREILAEYVARIPPEDNPHFSYKCRDCHDVGLIEIWHPETIWRLKKGIRAALYSAVVRCSCDAAQRWAQPKNQSLVWPIYNRLNFCLWITGDESEAREWLGSRIPHHAEFAPGLF